MRFTKGLMLGTAITADGVENSKKKIKKKGKHFMRKIGM